MPAKKKATATAVAAKKKSKASKAMAKSTTIKAKIRRPRKALVERAKIPAERPGRPGGRRDTNRKERTKGLTDAALELFLDGGIEAVTIEDITMRAGVAKGSFYRYFDDKQAIVEELFAPLYITVLEAFNLSLAAVGKATEPAHVVTAYEILAEGLMGLIMRHGDVALLYLQENRGPARGARAPAVRLAELIVDKGIEHTAAVRAHGVLRPFPAELSTLAVVGAAEVIMYRLLSGRLQSDPLEAPGQLIVLILDGIRDPAAGALFAHDKLGREAVTAG